MTRRSSTAGHRNCTPHGDCRDRRPTSSSGIMLSRTTSMPRARKHAASWRPSVCMPVGGEGRVLHRGDSIESLGRCQPDDQLSGALVDVGDRANCSEHCDDYFSCTARTGRATVHERSRLCCARRWASCIVDATPWCLFRARSRRGKARHRTTIFASQDEADLDGAVESISRFRRPKFPEKFPEGVHALSQCVQAAERKCTRVTATSKRSFRSVRQKKKRIVCEDSVNDNHLNGAREECPNEDVRCPPKIHAEVYPVTRSFSVRRCDGVTFAWAESSSTIWKRSTSKEGSARSIRRIASVRGL